MAYARKNYRTKKALKADANGSREWRDNDDGSRTLLVHQPRRVAVFQPGPFGPEVKDGTAYLEGPHYPEAHKWYASCQVKDGIVVPGSVK